MKKLLKTLFSKAARPRYICVGVVMAAIDRAAHGGMPGMDFASFVLQETSCGMRKVSMSTTSMVVNPAELDVYVYDILPWERGAKRLEDIEAHLEMKTDAPKKLGYKLIGTHDARATIGNELPRDAHYSFYECPMSRRRRVVVQMNRPVAHGALFFFREVAAKWLNRVVHTEDIGHLLDTSAAEVPPLQNDENVPAATSTERQDQTQGQIQDQIAPVSGFGAENVVVLSGFRSKNTKTTVLPK